MHSLMNTINALKQTNAQSVGTVPSHTDIAASIFRDLRSWGLRDKDIVAVSSELLNHLTADIRERNVQAFENAKTRDEN